MISSIEVDLKAIEKNRFLKFILQCMRVSHTKPPPSFSGGMGYQSG